MRKLLALTTSMVLVTLILAMSGCTTNNANTPTPTAGPTAATSPTAVPSPNSTLPVQDKIVGYWKGLNDTINYSMQFFANGKLIFDQDGNQGNGGWIKLNDTQYKIGVLDYDTNVTINSNMTFVWGNRNVMFVKES